MAGEAVCGNGETGDGTLRYDYATDEEHRHGQRSNTEEDGAPVVVDDILMPEEGGESVVTSDVLAAEEGDELIAEGDVRGTQEGAAKATAVTSTVGATSSPSATSATPATAAQHHAPLSLNMVTSATAPGSKSVQLIAAPVGSTDPSTLYP
ncbi:unnamed protein product [Phytophthora fragariaefolia]|uniref:Unnamed protein product n=1 Tax=Phytophthora fragariaefolia TaxID=1490495 RepID=A0A9W6TVI3_9STRA|nr:unnamed protein product [Phytophthora fragariaefolia]